MEGALKEVYNSEIDAGTPTYRQQAPEDTFVTNDQDSALCRLIHL